ncbi:hypothetical protein C8R44DRAFT_891725 [Mycena epipterygia]|nr:hypothetical protein C8R44DRAFT_891725 [Mycena epipterygia]
MIDTLYIALVVCLLASSLNRLLRMLGWLRDYFLRPRNPDLIPYFDQQGQLIGMVRMSTGYHVGRTAAEPAFEASRGDTTMSQTRRQLSPKTLSKPTRDLNSPQRAIPQIAPPLIWDCWPDGKFQCLFSLQELADTNHLATNWVLEPVIHRGSSNAFIWQKGKEERRRCVGVIECQGTTCPMQLAPSARAVVRHRQLKHDCVLCDDTLVFRECGIESSIYRFRDGAFFIHRGTHTHSRFTHSSVHQPDGSLAFVDYAPKYTITKSDVPRPVQLAKSHGSSSGSEDNSSQSEWEGIIDYASRTSDALDDTEQDELDDAEQWELHEDPDADEIDDD